MYFTQNVIQKTGKIVIYENIFNKAYLMTLETERLIIRELQQQDENSFDIKTG